MEFDKMNNKEKFEFLVDKQIDIVTQQFLNGNNLVGNGGGITLKYSAICNGVRVSNWCFSNEEAMVEAKENIMNLAN